MSIAVGIYSTGNTNYKVRIIYITAYRDNKVKNSEFTKLKLNTLDSNRLEIIKTSKDYVKTIILGN